MTNTEQALYKAIEASIRKIGLANFKATSLFMSSYRSAKTKAAA